MISVPDYFVFVLDFRIRACLTNGGKKYSIKQRKLKNTTETAVFVSCVSRIGICVLVDLQPSTSLHGEIIMTRILFQGDSITDAGRDRNNDMFPGNGYPNHIMGRLGVRYPGKYECLNRGISGNRIVDLYARIKCDFINLHPDCLSILIGINDVWHEQAFGNGVSAGKFEKVYAMLLEEIREALPEIKLVVMEPFVLTGTATGGPENDPGKWDFFRTETALRAQASRRIAENYGAVFVELQKDFDAASEKAPASFWLMDGVHPTPMGHTLITDKWLETVGL